MKKNKIVFIIFNLIFSLILAVFLVNTVIFGLCFHASSVLDRKETKLMSFVIYGSSQEAENETISARLSILDSDGNEKACIERSWNGNYLSIDFLSAEFGDNKFYFPYEVFCTETITGRNSERNKRKGIKLFKYYLENGECLLQSSESSESERNSAWILSLFARSPMARIAPGFSRRYSVNLFRCENGVFYGIYVNEDGELELRK